MDRLTCVRDFSWELLLDPPVVSERGKGITYFDLNSLDNLDFFNIPGNTDADRASFLIDILVQFLSTSVSSDGRFSARPLSDWIRLHVKQLYQPQDYCSVELSPTTSPFPIEDLTGYSRPECPLKNFDACRAKLNLAPSHEGGSNRDPGILCHQLLIRSVLVLAASIFRMPNYSPELGVSLVHLNALALLAVTLARLNHVPGVCTVEGSVQCAKDALRVREAPAIVAHMAKIFCSVGGLPEPEKHTAAMKIALIGLGCSLMSFRHLVAAGAREELATNTGNTYCWIRASCK